MAIKEVTPQQAHDVLSADPDVAYIDVRTEREFAAGHPQGAVNIPVAFPDPARGMVMNADFVKVVEGEFSQGQEDHRRLPSGPAIERSGGIAATGGLSRGFEHARRFRRHA